MRRWLWSNSLSIVMLAAFVVFVAGQALAGWQVRNEELTQAGQAADSLWAYLGSGHFGEALLENWESEFLQMGAYVLLTAYLVQKGSPESKPLDGKDRPGDDPDHAGDDSPSWSRRPGWRQVMYRNSLALVLLLFFALSFLGHLIAGTAAYNEEQKLQTGAAAIGVWQFAGTPDFWFQSMQNWQSEFFSVGALVLLSVVLRQHGSPQSKPVTAPHDQTGDE
ncbi:MAG: hypothetical protein HOV78_29835 [Hamadaea sp.]|nr:hypothetical protein [Hamadaea sp.]NUT04858.1 hypothetical protein [Hamadaea sp.]